jgi:phage tail-like protein
VPVSPHPLADGLPAIFRGTGDEFVERFCGGLDAVLAPILVTLDSLDAYVDPRLTPEGFLDWLGGWVALGARLRWPEESWRVLIAEAGELFRWRGTARALRRFVELYTGGEVEVVDPGGSSVVEGAEESAAATRLAEAPVVVVRVSGGRVDPRDPAQVEGLEHVIRESVPAHLPHWLEVKA